MLKKNLASVLHPTLQLFSVSILAALLVGGCNALATPRPTAAPTQTERVVVVVVTATVPPTDTPNIAVEPTITPLATLTPLTNLTPTVAATNTRTPAPRATTANPARTATPSHTVTSAPPPPPPNFAYPAPNALSPTAKDGKHTNDDIPFEWNFSDGRPLELGNADECYLLQVTFTESGTGKARSDSFDTCTFPGSFSIQTNVKARFVLNRPTRQGPNYSALVPDTTIDYEGRWCVSVVRKTGTLDPSHIQYVSESPSSCLTFPMQGQ